jgi:hypothetical protein
MMLCFFPLPTWRRFGLVLQMQRPQDADAWRHGVASMLYDGASTL